MKRSILKLNINHIIQVILIWFIFQSVISSSLLKYSNYSGILPIIRYFSLFLRLFMMGLGVYCEIKKKIDIKLFITLVFYTTIVIISKGYNDSWQFVDALFIAFIFKDEISREQIIDIFFKTIIVSCIIVFVAHFAGIFPNFVVRRIDGRDRVHLGFAHPNSLGYYIMICSFLFVLKIKGRIKYIYIVAMIVAAYFTYVYPNSFSSALSIMLLALYLLVNKLYIFMFKKNVIKSNLIRIASIIVVPLIIFGIFWIVSNSASSLYANDTLSTLYSRFRLGNQAIQQYGIHLFGSKDIEFVGTAARYFGESGKKYFTVDCFYIQILVKSGIIPSLLFFIYYIVCIKTSIRERDSDLLVILVILAFYSISESMILAVPTSFIFILSSQYIFKKKINRDSPNTYKERYFSTNYVEKRI